MLTGDFRSDKAKSGVAKAETSQEQGGSIIAKTREWIKDNKVASGVIGVLGIVVTSLALRTTGEPIPEQAGTRITTTTEVVDSNGNDSTQIVEEFIPADEDTQDLIPNYDTSTEAENTVNPVDDENLGLLLPTQLTEKDSVIKSRIDEMFQLLLDPTTEDFTRAQTEFWRGVVNFEATGSDGEQLYVRMNNPIEFQFGNELYWTAYDSSTNSFVSLLVGTADDNNRIYSGLNSSEDPRRIRTFANADNPNSGQLSIGRPISFSANDGLAWNDSYHAELHGNGRDINTVYPSVSLFTDINDEKLYENLGDLVHFDNNQIFADRDAYREQGEIEGN